MSSISRRSFAKGAIGLAAWGALASRNALLSANEAAPSKMAFGLVTYLWGQDWDLPTLIANCEKTKVLGVELRTTHKHGVEPSLGERQRAEVRKRFDDSPVTLLGPGSNERFDSPDAKVLEQSIQRTKEFIVLSHDVGGTGVKVKPDSFQNGVPREKTIEQIGHSLNEVGKFAEGYGQQVRLEVHGSCAELPTIKAIMDIADDKNVAVCWNCNPQDLAGRGLAENFKLVRDRFGDTVHVHQLDDDKYPYAELFDLLVRSDYAGWILLEAGGTPKDPVAALARQRELFNGLLM